MRNGGVTLITGGGTGLGAALAKRLTSRSQEVLITGRRLSPLLKTKSEVRNQNLVRVVAADIGTPSGRDDILAALGEEVKLKCLIHNAAILEPVGRLVDVKMDQWRDHMSINLDGPLALTQALIPMLIPKEDEDENQTGGRILHISSGAAHYPYRGWGPYCISKSAFHMMYRVLASELSLLGIAVGSAKPGVMDTPMQDLIRSKSTTEVPDVGRFRVLMDNGMLWDPSEVARFLDWLLHETNDVEFSEREWDVRDEEYSQRWQGYE